MSGQPKALVLGGRTGLVGQALSSILADNGRDVLAVGRQDFDPLDQAACEDFLDKHQPDIVFNTVAYTSVDQAESEPEAAALLNKTLPALWGRLARQRSIRLVHYSTDFVFDGKGDIPYQPTDPTGPASVYGATKLAGERALADLGLERTLIIRTAWIFGPGKTNFVDKILTLARERKVLNVVHDQIGSPTYTRDLARYTIELTRKGASGIYHIVNSGQASWCELAAEAVHIAGIDCRVQPIPSSAYPQKAARPAYSVLSTQKFTETTGVVPRPWVQGLRNYVLREVSADGLE